MAQDFASLLLNDILIFSRKRARVVEWGSLENCYTSNGIGGSNPPASAIFRKGFLNANLGRREAPTLMHSPRRIQNPKGFSTLRVARRLPILYE